MQSIILCAGMGTRITGKIGAKPKCLLTVGNETLLERQLRLLGAQSDKKPIVVVGYLQEMVREAIGSKAFFVENVRYATTNILKSLELALPRVSANDDLVCLPGDLVFDESIPQRLVDASCDVTLVVQTRTCDAEAVKVIVENGRIKRIGKDVPIESTSVEFLGILKVKKAAVPLFKKHVQSLIDQGSTNAYMFTSVQRMVDEGVEVGVVDVASSRWEEIDFYEDYMSAQEKFTSDGTSERV